MKIFNSIAERFFGEDFSSVVFSGFARDGDKYSANSSVGALSFFTGCDYSYLSDINKYEAIILFSYHTNQRNIVSLLNNIDRKTVGYIFPVTSLRFFDEFPDERWMKTFAVTGVEKLIHGGIGLKCFKENISGDFYKEGFNFFDLLNDNTVLLVVGKEQLSSCDISLNEILLILHRDDYFPIKKNNYLRSGRDFKNKLKLKKMSSSAVQLINILFILVNNSKHEENPVSRFITLYQIVEIYLEKVFLICVKVISSSDVLDPYSLKVSLSKCAGDRYRLALLYSNFIPNADSGVFNNCRDIINNFLSEQLEIGDCDFDWSKSLYRLRNLFVHARFKLTDTDADTVSSICDFFESCCFEIMINFDESVEIDAISLAD
ncbi:hypothetical protein [Solidesulfovibrio sp. C21]|uniref:hypothetical protein n=1 Tax=Solidesulfovibrio sp. C21 TaxID=3398613 RepID=UPI0039FDD68F